MARKIHKNNKQKGPDYQQKKRSKNRGVKHSAKSIAYTIFDVKLSLLANVFTGKDRKNVSLSSVIRPKPGKSKQLRHSPMDQESAARQLSKGTKLDQLSGLLEAMAHKQRICILIKLLGGDATHKLLSKETRLKAGPLYHHIRELRSAGLIGPKVRDLYSLSKIGRRAIMTALAMGRVYI